LAKIVDEIYSQEKEDDLEDDPLETEINRKRAYEKNHPPEKQKRIPEWKKRSEKRSESSSQSNKQYKIPVGEYDEDTSDAEETGGYEDDSEEPPELEPSDDSDEDNHVKIKKLKSQDKVTRKIASPHEKRKFSQDFNWRYHSTGDPAKDGPKGIIGKQFKEWGTKIDNVRVCMLIPKDEKVKCECCGYTGHKRETCNVNKDGKIDMMLLIQMDPLLAKKRAWAAWQRGGDLSGLSTAEFDKFMDDLAKMRERNPIAYMEKRDYPDKNANGPRKDKDSRNNSQNQLPKKTNPGNQKIKDGVYGKGDKEKPNPENDKYRNQQGGGGDQKNNYNKNNYNKNNNNTKSPRTGQLQTAE
jgi:hypothetical protein